MRGRPVGTENAVGVKTVIEYDADGRTAFESYPYTGPTVGGGEAFTYDALNRVVQIDRPGGAQVHYTYTATTVAIEDEKGHVTTQTWAAFGSPSDRRLVSVKNHANKTWTYTYNPVGSLTGVAQPAGPSRSWAYDSHHWLAQEVHPESGTVDYEGYDHVGHLTRKEVRRTGD